MKDNLIDILRLFFEYHFLLVIFVWLLSYWESRKVEKRLKTIEQHLGINQDNKK